MWRLRRTVTVRVGGEGGGRGARGNREGNEVVIGHMQRGNSGVRGGAVSHEYQV